MNDQHTDEDSSDNTILFTPENVQAYLDSAIVHWREIRGDHEAAMDQLTNVPPEVVACIAVDVFQSVRTSLFGTTLP